MSGLTDYIRKLIRQYSNDSELGQKLRQILHKEEKMREERKLKIKKFIKKIK
jgi:hypothetical protein